MPDKPTARETYQSYLKGEISLDEIDRRAQEWYEQHRRPAPAPKEHPRSA